MASGTLFFVEHHFQSKILFALETFVNNAFIAVGIVVEFCAVVGSAGILAEVILKVIIYLALKALLGGALEAVGIIEV